MTQGEAKYFSVNINSFIGFVFLGSYALGIGLVLWYAAFRANPIANAIAKKMTANVTQQ